MLGELMVTSCQTWHLWWSDRSAMTSSDCPAGGSRAIDGAAVAAAVVLSSAPALVQTVPVSLWARIPPGDPSRGGPSGEHILRRDASIRLVERPHRPRPGMTQ